MSDGYSVVPIVALVGYIFLLMAFTAAKKTKVINSFICLLIIMIAWTGGSFAMRRMLWPSPHIWFHVSLAGMMFIPWDF
jgi:hypothetical protein